MSIQEHRSQKDKWGRGLRKGEREGRRERGRAGKLVLDGNNHI